MKIYISGKITGLYDYAERFKEAEEKLKAERHVILTPLSTPLGLDYEDYMHIAYAMIDCADAVYMLYNWVDSKGAKLEFEYAKSKNKQIIFEKSPKNDEMPTSHSRIDSDGIMYFSDTKPLGDNPIRLVGEFEEPIPGPPKKPELVTVSEKPW